MVVHSPATQKPKRKRVRRSNEVKAKGDISSYDIFVQFVTYDKYNNCDASGILSSPCYEKWCESRRKPPKNPHEAFRRALTAHCRGVDGRKPFPADIERSLLKELRKKKKWACFEDFEKCGSIGIQGFPSLGFHEKIRMRQKMNSLAHAEANDEKTIGKELIDFHSPLEGSFRKTYRATKILEVLHEPLNVNAKALMEYQQVRRSSHIYNASLEQFRIQLDEPFLEFEEDQVNLGDSLTSVLSDNEFCDVLDDTYSLDSERVFNHPYSTAFLENV